VEELVALGGHPLEIADERLERDLGLDLALDDLVVGALALDHRVRRGRVGRRRVGVEGVDRLLVGVGHRSSAWSSSTISASTTSSSDASPPPAAPPAASRSAAAAAS